MRVSQIAAMSENRVIGKDQGIPWSVPGEQKRFKEITMGKVVIMGRKTFESLPGHLPGRRICVISRTMSAEAGDVEVFRTLEDALEHHSGEEEIVIGGGEQVYRLAMPYTSTIYLTVVHTQVDGDTYFPEFEHLGFELAESEDQKSSLEFTYNVYHRPAPEKQLGRIA